MTPKEYTYKQLVKESESGLRAELEMFDYYPSQVISKDILINILMQVYFGGADHD